ncbi:MAG: peptidyl-prolyl cis-trans isomerase [Oscillospiraceae bacterium]|jgi:hypothetical protein|nr:peptidyl-prolyl cis-trans isomerase [Oscillospiraceae bacterium]
MKAKTLLALLLCAFMLLSVAACAKTDAPANTSEKPAESAEAPSDGDSEPAPPVAETFDFDAAYAAFAPDDVVMTIDGTDVTWDEYYYYLFSAILDVQATTGELPDWSLPVDEGLSYTGYIVNSADENASIAGAFLRGARELDVTLTDENRADIALNIENAYNEYGGAEGFNAFLRENGCSFDVYDKISKINMLAYNSFLALYGESAVNVPDEDVAAQIADSDYLMAKHILVLTTKDDGSGYSVPMTDEEKAEARAKVDGILAQLDAYAGDDFDALFDELMNANSEDTAGLALNPNGYLFQAYDMVTEFEEGTRALAVGSHSGVVETDYGFHIIYRLPVNYDVVPLAYQGYQAYTLRYISAQSMFTAQVDKWKSELVVENGAVYDSLNLAEIFKVAKAK